MVAVPFAFRNCRGVHGCLGVGVPWPYRQLCTHRWCKPWHSRRCIYTLSYYARRRVVPVTWCRAGERVGRRRCRQCRRRFRIRPRAQVGRWWGMGDRCASPHYRARCTVDSWCLRMHQCPGWMVLPGGCGLQPQVCRRQNGHGCVCNAADVVVLPVMLTVRLAGAAIRT